MKQSKIAFSLKPSLVRMARLNRGLSQEQVADAANISLTTYGDIERGVRAAKKEVAEMIAHAVRMNRHHIFVQIEGKRKFKARIQ